MKVPAAMLALCCLVLGCAPTPPLPARCAVSGLEKIGGPIALVDEGGRAVTEADFADRPTLLYFGFANCPDVCPTALQAMRLALEARPASAPPLSVAMVTVDPARDTPEVLSQYVASAAFPAGLKGLGGTPEQIRAATDAFKVYAQRRDDPASGAGYVVDHSRMLYLMDRDWRAAAVFPDSMPPAEMAACIDHALAKRS
jgi:protein SCO1/2